MHFIAKYTFQAYLVTNESFRRIQFSFVNIDYALFAWGWFNYIHEIFSNVTYALIPNIFLQNSFRKWLVINWNEEFLFCQTLYNYLMHRWFIFQTHRKERSIEIDISIMEIKQYFHFKILEWERDEMNNSFEFFKHSMQNLQTINRRFYFRRHFKMISQ